ncbi:hypothetical protein HaLaN_00765 [Haematococcus lacustris]|uniref:Uncharacterized protein n=1 Tax=Haematococcus lacustris TaxID=44745 RepID=A0A699YEB4_HAELA|nr:hypothetical protein HaLaN_00765 [Haematococcus lacustris]
MSQKYPAAAAGTLHAARKQAAGLCLQSLPQPPPHIQLDMPLQPLQYPPLHPCWCCSCCTDDYAPLTASQPPASTPTHFN